MEKIWQRGFNFIKIRAQELYYSIPLPVKLQSGVWVITYNDVMSKKIRNGEFEGDEQKILARFLGDDMVLFDIGTNFGIYSLSGSKKVGSRGKVVSLRALAPGAEAAEKEHFHQRLQEYKSRTAGIERPPGHHGLSHLHG